MEEIEMFAEFSQLKDKLLEKFELIHSLNEAGVVVNSDVEKELSILVDQMGETILCAGSLADLMEVNIKADMEDGKEVDATTEHTNNVEEAEKTAEASSHSTVCMKEVMEIEENINGIELPEYSLESKEEDHDKENIAIEYTNIDEEEKKINMEKVHQKFELKSSDGDETNIGVLPHQIEKDFKSIVPMIHCILENQKTLLKNQSIMNQKLDHCTYNGVRAVPDEEFDEVETAHTDEMFKELEEKLEDPHIRRQYVSKLSFYGGDCATRTAINILKKLATDDVYMQYSFQGQRGTKTSFIKNFRNVYKVVSAIVSKRHKEDGSNVKQIVSVFLKNAKKRHEASLARMQHHTLCI